jgi:recombination protein RecT
VATNPALKECETDSIVASALLGESLQLSPSPQLGQYYLVPYKDNNTGKINATFQLGYKGLLQLAIRSGYYKKIVVLPIKEGELVKFDQLEEEIVVNLIEDDDERESKPTIGYYAMFEYNSGFRKAIYWSKEKMMRHADKYSKAFSREAFERIERGEIPQEQMGKYSSFYYKDFDQMSCKTMLRQLIGKWGIMSIDLQNGLVYDQATPIIKDEQFVDAVYPDSPNGKNDFESEIIINSESNKEEQEVIDEKPQTAKRGRPKVIANVVPDDAKPQATKPFEMKNEPTQPVLEFDGEF